MTNQAADVRPSGVFDPATYEPRSGKTFWMAATDEFAGGQGGSSRHAHRQLHDRTTSLPFKFELELISSLSGAMKKGWCSKSMLTSDIAILI